MKLAKKYPVVIIGSGPVGILAAKLLQLHRVPHLMIDRRIGLRSHHPQAHFINIRTIEILKSFVFQAYHDAVHASPAVLAWKDFSYTSSLTGVEFVREDKYQPHIDSSLSPAGVLHLPQHHFETILLNDLNNATFLSQANGTYINGYDSKVVQTCKESCSVQITSTQNTQEPPITVDCDFVIAADGAHSKTRNQIRSHMEGEEAMQHLMNVHFVCPGLSDHLQARPAMLYFVSNPAMVAVFVSHDPMKDEWVCQIPYFPPFQQPSDYTTEKILSLLSQTIFNKKQVSDCPCPIHIKHINSWLMHAQVASRFTDPDHGRVFLVGDAAHRFPPAGGFGMNTGLQDVHNLIWKMSHVLTGKQSISWLAQSYEKERKKIARENTELSLRNFQRSADAAAALGLDPALAKLALNLSDNSITNTLLPFAVRKQTFLTAVGAGLSSMYALKNWRNNPYGRLRVNALQKLVKEKKTLPLIFPEEDVHFTYGDGKDIVVGRRVDHTWLMLHSHNSEDDDNNLIVSTVDLPGIVLQLLGIIQKQTNQTIISAPYLLFSGKSQWNSSFLGEMSTMSNELKDIIVPVILDFDLSTPSELQPQVQKLLHLGANEDSNLASVQQRLQLPIAPVTYKSLSHSILSSSDRMTKEDLLRAKEEELANTRTENYRRLQQLLTGQLIALPLLQRLEVNGMWAMHASLLNEQQCDNNMVSKQLPCLIRPDGHVVLTQIKSVADISKHFNQ